MKATFTTLLLLVCVESDAQFNRPHQSRDTLPRPDSSIVNPYTQEEEALPTMSIDLDRQDEPDPTPVSSLLSAARNPFLNAAAYHFSFLRFRLRGYESRGTGMYLNGLPFTNLENGYTSYYLWAGLNQVMRQQQFSFGLEPNDFAMGTIGLNTQVDLRAGSQRIQTQMGYAISNRSYRHRIQFSTASGFNKKGWAYALAVTARFAKEGLVPGTFYKGLSYYAALDKKMGDRQIFSLIGFGVPTETGRQTASVQEAIDLAGTSFYNPSWGYQNGKKRNANVARSFQPVWMALHEYTFNPQSRWVNSLAWISGKSRYSGFDWYNAPDPRPDYYRYLPSNYLPDQPSQANYLSQLIRLKPDILQINWPKLYEVNRGNSIRFENVNGKNGHWVSGNRSLYIISNRVNQLNRWVWNSTYHGRISNRSSLTGGLQAQHQVNHHYQEVQDLLGGDFWVNVNQFAERDFPNDPNAIQYDMDQPNQIKKAGEPYGPHYSITSMAAKAWLQSQIKWHRFDVFAAASIAAESFFRTGLNRNGLFPRFSLGNSKKSSFINPAVKGGFTYKLNGRNYFILNGGWYSEAPYPDQVFVSQRTRNEVPAQLKKEIIMTAETGYRLQSPHLKLGITGYYTTTQNEYMTITFYHDQYRSFVNYALSGIHKIFYGLELGFDYKINSSLNIFGAGAMGRYYYNSRPQGVITIDNDARVITSESIYWKNFRIPLTPQNAFNAGVFYRSPQFWYLSFTGNYLGYRWMRMNPFRRTAEAVGDMGPDVSLTDPLLQSMIAQDRLDDGFSLDFFGGWSKRLPMNFAIHNKTCYLIFTLGINNILNNKKMHSGGYEQMRFDYSNKNALKFPPKYSYANGLNYFGAITLRF